MDDPTPENSITEVKVTPANSGKSDLQPNKSGVASTYMDVDETPRTSEGNHAVGAELNGVSADGKDHDQDRGEENEDNVTEQTHHIIVPSYR